MLVGMEKAGELGSTGDDQFSGKAWMEDEIWSAMMTFTVPYQTKSQLLKGGC